MSTPDQDLPTLQKWLLSVITHPAGVAAGAQSAAGVLPGADAHAIVPPSQNQSSHDRLAVYGNAYFARLLEVMRELFPCLADAVGNDLFDQFVLEYLERYPPRSYTLSDLPDRFASFLDESCPGADNDRLRFVVDLARLERAIDEVFDGPGPEHCEPLSAAQIAAWLAAGEPADVRLTLAPGARLLAFKFPASTYFSAWKHGDHSPWPEPQAQHILLARRDFVVRRYELSKAQFALLGAIERGLPLGQALIAASEHIAADELPTAIRAWFTFWSAERFFIATET